MKIFIIIFFSDELPVQLTLPRALREANRQQLSSLALLGQEFWRYPMSTPKLSSKTGYTNQTMSSETIILRAENGQHITSSTSHIMGTVFSSTSNQNIGNVFSSNIGQQTFPGCVSQADTPSDTTSSLSSFTTSTGQQLLLSPESVDSVVLTMSPVESSRTGIVGKTSTFKVQTKKTVTEKYEKQQNQFVNPLMFGGGMESGIRAPRPTPPNTLHLSGLKTPPAPPPRFSKTPTPLTPTTPTENQSPQSNNFTVTTTVTFSVEGNNPNPSQIVEVVSPQSNSSFQTISKRLSPEGECKQTVDTLSSQGSKRWQSQSSKDSVNHRKILSPSSVDTPTGRVRRSKARKESKHYQVRF